MKPFLLNVLFTNFNISLKRKSWIIHIVGKQVKQEQWLKTGQLSSPSFFVQQLPLLCIYIMRLSVICNDTTASTGELQQMTYPVVTAPGDWGSLSIFPFFQNWSREFPCWKATIREPIASRPSWSRELDAPRHAACRQTICGWCPFSRQVPRP